MSISNYVVHESTTNNLPDAVINHIWYLWNVYCAGRRAVTFEISKKTGEQEIKIPSGGMYPLESQPCGVGMVMVVVNNHTATMIFQED